jgi:O-antigen ligase
MTAVLLVPLAVAMLYEKATGNSAFSALGANMPVVRDGTVRAQGPFAHPILAGCVGAACLPLAASLWRSHRSAAIAGSLAALTIAITSSSSTPIVGALIGIGALLMWSARHHMKLLRWTALLGYVALDIVMNAPAYYILSRIDMTGSSTSWYRAALIQVGIEHFSEWWLAGTSYTRHWFPSGVPWSANQIDVTNHYLRMGIDGGLPLLLSFVAVMAKGFSLVGRSWRDATSPESAFAIWALGASLFVHASAFVSVSYFDQSAVFLYLTLAAIASASVRQPKTAPEGTGQSPLVGERWQGDRATAAR